MFKYLIVLIFFLLCGCKIYSQQYNFTSYSIEDGLAQSQANAMYQDSRGYIWIGTDGGLSRFDGINFRNYTNGDGLSSNQIISIYEDRKGNMWFGTKDGYLNMYDGVRFYHYNEKKGLKSPTILAITEDLSGNIIIGAERAGLYRLKDKHFKRVALMEGDSGQLSITSIYVTSSGILWAGTMANGVYMYSNPYFKNFSAKDGLSGNSISSICEDNKGNICIGTSQGLSKYNGDIFINFTEKDGLAGNEVSAIVTDNSGNIWLGTESKGISRYDGKFFYTFNKQNGLCHDFINSMLCDRNGNLWVGTYGGGICKFKGERFIHLTEKDGLAGNLVMSICEDRNKNLWFGTYGYGISKYACSEPGVAVSQRRIEPVEMLKCRTNGKKFTTFNKNDGLCSDVIYCILEDNEGNMWFGSKGYGASKFDGKKFINYNIYNGLPSNLIYDIIQDRYGNILFATLEGGISIYDGKNFTNIGTNQGLTSNYIYTLFEDKDGNIWLGTEDAGIAMIFAECSSNTMIKNKKINENHIINITKYGLTNKKVLSILQDVHDNIWIGTLGGGITRFDGVDLKNFSIRDGLNSNSVYQMLIDSEGFLWVGTERGLNKIDIRQNSDKIKVKTFAKTEGFIGIETNFNAAIEDSKGYLWFGNLIGATRYNHKADTLNKYEPLTSVTDIRLLYKKTDWSEITDSLTSWGDIPEYFELSYSQNHLTFEFIGIDHEAPEKVKYQWFLEGFDKGWSPVLEKREVTYANIPPGKYTFTIKAYNSDNIAGKEHVSIKFVILPPFWNTWWFYSIIALFAIIIIVAFIKLKLKRISKERDNLAKKIEERTKELVSEKRIVDEQSRMLQKQKENLEKINQELEKLSIVARKTDNSVAIADPKGNIEWVNEGFTRLYGYTLEETISKFGSNIIDISTNPDIIKSIKKCVEEKTSVEYVSVINHKSGMEIWAQTTLTSISDSNGVVTKILVIEIDVTKIKKAEEEVKFLLEVAITRKNETERQKKEIEAKSKELEVVNKELEKLSI
ncbi:MAG: PAS domain S-box protein [Bacteroidia bacterium]|nr:PAS domain S-box protein [Bacteroidia bacterium]